MEDWAEIRQLHRAESVSIKEIARRLGVARNPVRAALASDRPPRYERAARGSVADAYEPVVAGDGRVRVEPTRLASSGILGWRRNDQ